MTRVAVEVVEGVAVLRFLHPILTMDVLAAAAGAVESLGNPSALVVTSEHPRIFLAGAHLGEIAGLDHASSRGYAEEGRRFLGALLALPAPTVAAVHGACAGGGLDLALACDWITAGPQARFGHPGIRRGLVTGWGGTSLLPERIGRRRALALLAEARLIPAGEAVRIGLADEIQADPSASARRRALALADLHPRRLALWRAARSGGFVDIFAGNVVHTRR